MGFFLEGLNNKLVNEPSWFEPLKFSVYSVSFSHLDFILISQECCALCLSRLSSSIVVNEIVCTHFMRNGPILIQRFRRDIAFLC